ncbi:MAG: DUF1569 domain-containing protein [Luteitalea sp.]|nr:DUF1569 domain-containing protein [Luteitalea sp.]
MNAQRSASGSTDAVLSSSTLSRLATQLDNLALILGDATPEALGRRPSSGKWSAHEHLAHLGRHQQVFLERMARIVREDEPPLGSYRAEQDPEWPAWQALPLDEVVARLRHGRRELLSFLASLQPEHSARVGTHPVFGRMSIPVWIEFFLVHAAHHLYAVMKLARGGA